MEQMIGMTKISQRSPFNAERGRYRIVTEDPRRCEAVQPPADHPHSQPDKKGISYNTPHSFMKLTSRYRERFIKRVRHHQGHAVGFRTDQIRLPNRKIAHREYMTHPGAVGILAFETPNKILLVKQYRYPVGQFTYEIPAGKLSPGEKPDACIRRELEEETGFIPKRFKKLVAYWPTAAFSDEVIHLYYATDLIPSRMNPDDDEFLELVRVSPQKLERMIRAGKIQDSKTLIAFLAWKNYIAR